MRAHRDKAEVQTVFVIRTAGVVHLFASRSRGQPGDCATNRSTFRLIFKNTVHWVALRVYFNVARVFERAATVSGDSRNSVTR